MPRQMQCSTAAVRRAAASMRLTGRSMSWTLAVVRASEEADSQLDLRSWFRPHPAVRTSTACPCKTYAQRLIKAPRR